MDGQTLRDRFELRLQVAENDDSLGDRGNRYVGVKSCKPMIEEAAAALDREQALRKEADEALKLAWEELNRATEDLDRERARLDEVRGEVRLLAYPYGHGRFAPATIEPDFTDLCPIVGLKAEDF